ncbi:MAG: hypothetical protein ABIS28_12425 [Caldimonas sp.]
MLTLRVFLSSPGDVAEERRLAVETVRALEDSPLLRERVNLIVVAWDDPVAGSPLDARETPQSSVNRWSGRPADCDLTIVVLWSRLGTPLSPTMTRTDGSRFASGTVWEVEDAIAADRPVFVYRRTEKPRIDLDDADFDAKRSQYDAVRRWFETLRDADGARTGVNEYATPAQFQQLLRAHLEAFIGRRLAALAAPGTTIAAAPATDAPPAAVGPAPSRQTRTAAEPSRRAANGDNATAAATTATLPNATGPAPTARLRWLVPALSVGIVVIGAIAWSLRSGGTSERPGQPPSSSASTGSTNTTPSTEGPSNTVASDKVTSKPPASASALPQVRLAGPADAVFTAMRGSTYSVVTLTPENGTNAQWRLRLRVRLKTGQQSGGMNFWDSAFRLVIDGVPRAAVSTLNEVVDGGASKEGEIVFALPWAVQTLALRIHHYGETADLPLAVTGARASEPPSVPPGPRRVTLDGPAELAFTASPHAIYTILAVGSEARRPGVFGLRVRMRMLVLDRYEANFWDDRFRLLVDGQPLEPDSRLNEVVGGNAAKDADVTFEVPDNARALVLHVQNNPKDSADVPLKLGPKS